MKFKALEGPQIQVFKYISFVSFLFNQLNNKLNMQYVVEIKKIVRFL